MHQRRPLAVLLLAGVLLEVTDGSLHVFGVAFGAGVLGCGYHGIFSAARVRGASGAIYGILWSQLALLALNWRDMPGRWIRLLSSLLLVAVEVWLYFEQQDAHVSYQSHLFGALAGGVISLVSGANVTLLNWELLLNVVGTLAYAGLTVAVFASRQLACGAWAATLVPLLMLDTWRHVRRSRLGLDYRQSAGACRTVAPSAPGRRTASTVVPATAELGRDGSGAGVASGPELAVGATTIAARDWRDWRSRRHGDEEPRWPQGAVTIDL